MAPKPTILLIPGAFTTPIGSTKTCYDALTAHLHKTNYPTVVARLPSAAPANPTHCSAAQDGAYVMETYLLPLLNQGKDVLIFAHSFGATCLGGDEEQSIARAQRERAGEPGGVLGLVYISFAFVPEGESQLGYLGGQWPPFCKVDAPSPGLLTFDPVIETLYNDTPPSMHAELKAGHIGSATSIFTTPVLAPLWRDPAFDGRRVCIKTLRDQTFPPAAQDVFIAGCGVEWEVEEVEGGHCAFIARAEEVSRVIEAAAGRWA